MSEREALELALRLTEQMSADAAYTTNALLGSMVCSQRMWEARATLAAHKVTALFAHPYAPSQDAIVRALHVSDYEAEKWLESTYGPDWSDNPASVRNPSAEHYWEAFQ